FGGIVRRETELLEDLRHRPSQRRFRDEDLVFLRYFEAFEDHGSLLSPWLELQIFVWRGIRKALDVIDARLLHAWPDAPGKRELVDGHVEHAVDHDLLDLVEHRLALLPIELPGLPREEVFDLGHDARRVDAVLGHVRLDPGRRIAGRSPESHDHAFDLVLAPRGQ